MKTSKISIDFRASFKTEVVMSKKGRKNPRSGRERQKVLEGERRCNRGKANGFKVHLVREKADFEDQERKLKLWEEAIVDQERQEKTCANCGHRRLHIKTQ